MNLIDVIKSQKTKVKLGEWKFGKVSSSDFPILKQRRLKLSSDWHWRVIKFDILERNFSCLVRLNIDKAYYSAILGHMDESGILKVICAHEFHMSHGDWHCHAVTCDIDDVMTGVLRDTDNLRVIERKRKSPLDILTVQKREATQEAIKVYRIRKAAEGGDLFADSF